MNKSLLTLLAAILVTSVSIAQTIRRVNNNTGISGTNVYSTFAAAHTAAIDNDIIIVEPSTTSYGDITITKKLKIYGNGYFLTTNTELKADQRNSDFGTIDFNTGSGGSEIYGVAAGNIQIYGVSNITISRNAFNVLYLRNSNKASTTFTNISNILISRNYFARIETAYSTGYTISSVLVNNNIFGYISTATDPGVQNWVVRNNTFFTTANSTSLANSVLENNFFSGGGSSPSLTNVTLSYNVSTAATFSGGFNNVNNYDIITNSELTGTGAGISADEYYIIKAGSNLKTLGNGSTEVGAYGGSTPYVVSGIPPIPSITNMINSGTGDNSNPLKVTISVKSNN